MSAAASILDAILEQKRREIAALDVRALRRAAEASPSPRSFLAALASAPSKPALIAELKRGSPSKGLFAPRLPLLPTARIYAANGAAAVSVLTDEHFFHGSLQTLRRLRSPQAWRGLPPLPLLRKDFLIEEAQLYQSRAAGADAVLLIAAALTDDARLAALHALALELGLTPLVEVHTLAELERVLRLPALCLLGINNRSLDTFQTSFTVTEDLRPRLPASLAVVAESGISTAADAQRMRRAGVSAILVGEALVTAPRISLKVRELSSPYDQG